MTVYPFPVGEVLSLYNRMAKLKPSSALDRQQDEPEDVVRISVEAKKRQILDQAGNEVRGGSGKPDKEDG